MSSIPMSNRGREVIYEGRAHVYCIRTGPVYVKIFSDGMIEIRNKKNDAEFCVLSLHSERCIVNFIDES